MRILCGNSDYKSLGWTSRDIFAVIQLPRVKGQTEQALSLKSRAISYLFWTQYLEEKRAIGLTQIAPSTRDRDHFHGSIAQWLDALVLESNRSRVKYGLFHSLGMGPLQVTYSP